MALSGIYVLQGVVPSEVAAAPYDVKVVETFDDNGLFFSNADVKLMTSGPGAVLGYFSLGEAENFRSYFRSIPKRVLGPKDPDWPGDYQVAYWTPEWRKVAKTCIRRMIGAGYDGVYFDVVDEYQLAWAQKNAPGGDAAGAMKTLVATLSAFAKDLGNDVQVWVNGGAELAADPAFVEAIDGMYIENLYYDFDGSNANATADVQHTLGQLKNVLNAGRPVIDVEYVAGDAKKIADVHRRAAAAGIGTYIGALDLNGIDLVDNPASSSPLK